MRSNINYGYVNVNNKFDENESAYKNTHRFIVNYIWSPIARISPTSPSHLPASEGGEFQSSAYDLTYTT
jgi:hypothetical protein